jgi:hypothetical protein
MRLIARRILIQMSARRPQERAVVEYPGRATTRRLPGEPDFGQARTGLTTCESVRDAGMSERPYKVEQWSKDFGGVVKLILEAADPKKAHAEFDRIVKRRPRGWYSVRWGTQVLREHPRRPP